MPQLQRILVPVDYSGCSKAALEYALFLGKRFDAQVTVLHVVWEPPPYVGMEVMTMTMPPEGARSLADYTRSMAEQEMNGFLTSIEEPVRQRLLRRFATGDATSAILRIAEEERYDIVIMGTHGRTGISHALLGSVAEKVVRKAHCPVLTVHDGVSVGGSEAA